MDNNLTTEELQKRLVWYETKYGPYIEKRGLRNWRNLFKKPSFSDILTLFLIAMALLLAYSYMHDIQVCRDYIGNQTAIKDLLYNTTRQKEVIQNVSSVNLSLFEGRR